MKMRWIRFPLAILLSLLTLLLLPSRASLQGGIEVRSQVDTKNFPDITAYVTVTDAQGQPITGLEKSAFEVTEEDGSGDKKSPDFSLGTVTETGEPLTVALAIDTSKSIEDAKATDDVKNAAKDFIDRLGPDDQASIFDFSTQVVQVQALTSDKNQLKKAIDGLQPGGTTALYEAVCQAANAVATVPGRKAVVLLTDGWNDSSLPRTKDEAIQCGLDSKAPVYTLGFGSAYDPVLEPIAAETGGVYRVTPSSSELQDLFSGLASQLESQYVIQYESPAHDDFDLIIRVSTPEGEGQDQSHIVFVWPTPTPTPTLTPTPTFTPTLTPTPTPTPAPTVPPIQLVAPADGTSVEGCVNLEWSAGPPGPGEAFDVRVCHGEGCTPVISAISTGNRSYQWEPTDGTGIYRWRVALIDASRQDVGAPSEIRQFTWTGGSCEPGSMMPLLVGGLLLLAGLGVLGVIITRRGRRPICPNCGRAMDPDWHTCLFCEQEAQATRRQELEPEVTPTREMGFEVEPPAREPEPTMIFDVEPRPTAWLVMVEGEREGQEYMLHAGDTAIGRAGTNDIIVDDSAVGRQQAKIRLDDDEFYIYDLAATNPTEVNDQEITKHKLQDGDRVRMGSTVFVFKRTQVSTR